ncbi:long-chain fatty acid--CoA ligase [Nocardioides dubius]|uniref:Long-chain fatty acid--CoA ligase n=1 Tax=Nocardioides dubius TaxID=317019 RepID=A0ABN1TJH9_9ACTN
MTTTDLNNLTIDQAVRRHASERPEEPAVVDADGTLSWAQLDRAAHQVADHLRATGIRPGDRVGWLGPNRTHYPAVLLGTWRAGAAMVGMNWRLPSGAITAAARAVALDHLVADARFETEARAAMGEQVSITAAGTSPWAQRSTTDEAPVTDADQVAMIYFTSGSTGTPKAVPLSRRAVEATMAHAQVHRYSPGDRALIVPPTFHAAGATWTAYCLKAGVTVHYSDDASARGLIDTLRDQAISHAILVPTLIHAVVDELDRRPEPLPALRHVAYGASPIPPALLNDAIRLLGCDFSQVYGMSETGGGVTFLSVEDHRAVDEHPERLASAGRPGVDVELQVRGPLGDVAKTGEAGEVWLRTPCLTTGYLAAEDPTGGVLRDGWLNTRDVGYQDADSYLYLLGRADDMIQTGAENVHPRAVEEVLLEHPAVADCAVYGVRHARWGEQVTAAVVSTGPAPTAEQLSEFCAPRLAGYQIPKRYLFVDELPRTAAGKVQRHELVALTPADD